ncbi:MAG: hypothetical protein R3B70_22555 [Polyangiaceae bacterium]
MNVGHGHGEFGNALVRRFEDIMRTGVKQFASLCDWWDLKTYDSPFRVLHHEFIDRYKAKWDHHHVLTRSKMVAMGVSVAKLALGARIKTYNTRAEFDVVSRSYGFTPSPTITL